MLDTKLKNELKAYLANLKRPVELQVNADDGDKSKQLLALANEIAELSELVSVKQQSSADSRTPCMRVTSAETGTAITFAGLPMGHEFTSLVLALLHTGGHPVKQEAAVLEQIRALPGLLDFEIFVSLSCQTCPGVVQALNLMAAVNPNIRTTMVDGALFQDEVSERNVLAVPTVFLNGEQFSQGAITLDKILSKVDSNAAARQAEALKRKAPFDMLVVGAGPAGASAAIYAARKGIRTGLVTERFGGQVADTMGIENFISVKATEGPKLVAHLEEHVRDYEVDIMSNQKVKSLREGNMLEVTLENGAVLQSRSLVIATGARWREMNVPGEREYRGRGVAYCPHCDGPLFKGKKVAVIGGGNSGIEAAIDLANIVEHVTVLEFDAKLRADDVLVRKARSMGNIHIITEAQTTEVRGDGKRVVGLSYKDRASGEMHEVELAGIFVQIGLVPNTEWLKGSGLELTPRGEVVIAANGETNIKGIFAAGDATTVPFKQIIIAMGSGATASLGAFDYLMRSSAPA
ncbi:alkyl hydroperoxide reductase subunit F [Aliiglaciecola sp. CAU 1673]|uniref:alkyl hydroperoxide reductase subunit F n=1 Tax=Aliiglaciecola sp. CAU 1673 TaxID=3032595 RepID=UPI0023DCD9FD|nr:alkyl hydroperoxide reductase subunit F [Aliiglaciecola sp. CAU 1673]MDF2177239.1 alkyl hydroperoxide reductase subunit F [Aliiglaciecola sp. CAU 1673]